MPTISETAGQVVIAFVCVWDVQDQYPIVATFLHGSNTVYCFQCLIRIDKNWWEMPVCCKRNVTVRKLFWLVLWNATKLSNNSPQPMDNTVVLVDEVICQLDTFSLHCKCMHEKIARIPNTGKGQNSVVALAFRGITLRCIVLSHIIMRVVGHFR